MYFISQAQDWVGCSEGLVGKLQVALEYTITDESIQGEILKTKKDFKNVYWELRTVQGMCPAGYARESSTFQTAVDSELSKRIGLGIGYQGGVQGSIGYQGYINEAEAVIKMNVRSYDHVYDLYFKSFAEKLQHLTQNQESPEHLLKSLGASLERYQNFESGEWRYFYVEQDLPELVLHYLIEKKILEKGSKASNVYDSFLQELKIKNYFVYCKRVTAPPQRNYSNEAAGSTATSQMSGTTYQSKSTGNQW